VQGTISADDRVLIDELYPKLRRFAATVGSYDIEPDDLVQESLVRTLRNRPLSDLDNPTAYLCRAMVNIASNQRRSFGRLRRALTRLGERDATPDTYPSDLDDLEALEPRARAVLYLVEIEGLSFDQVASAVGVSNANARKIAERSRRRLRQLVEERAE
jgi:RNA polymerase sigma-70 factor (ECF subfamily)